VRVSDLFGAARETGLDVVGAFHPGPGDGVPPGVGTLALLGPSGGAMWAAFRASPEARDGGPDPLDRWSRRVIDGLAARLGAIAFYPFAGPPWHPFQRWAARGEGAVVSPVAMQASPTRGLWASYRGALGFAARLELTASPAAGPCLGCPAPCLTACPVDAFAGGHYDVSRCVAHVGSPAGAACRQGCLVRAACPAGAGLDLPVEQRAFHMAAFLAANGRKVPAGSR
jgi:epoxyqueuosine reductase